MLCVIGKCTGAGKVCNKYIYIYIHGHQPDYTRKLVPITGRASLFLENFSFFKFQSQSKSNPNQIYSFFFALLSSSVSWAKLSCVVATIFSSLTFLSSSVSMAYLGRLVAASFSGLALLSSSVSTANLHCKKNACNAHQIWCATFVPSGTPYMA